mmetsp:Transcript_21097/g.68007  ORF Transcript_21097/g.68007 Transcript_21097/m.68007 type:complete len:206 (+) Transcript_21097:1637-2254(+)
MDHHWGLRFFLPRDAEDRPELRTRASGSMSFTVSDTPPPRNSTASPPSPIRGASAPSSAGPVLRRIGGTGRAAQRALGAPFFGPGHDLEGRPRLMKRDTFQRLYQGLLLKHRGLSRRTPRPPRPPRWPCHVYGQAPRPRAKTSSRLGRECRRRTGSRPTTASTSNVAPPVLASWASDFVLSVSVWGGLLLKDWGVRVSGGRRAVL